VQLSELVTTSRAVASTRKRTEKVHHLARALAQLAPDEREPGAAWLAGELLGGKLGLGPATVWKTQDVPAAPEPTLSVAEVAGELDALRDLAGPGSQTERLERFERLLARATADEQDFLRRLVVGELRQGALSSLLLDAVAKATRVAPAAVRRAHMFAGAAAPVVRAAFEGGEAELAKFDLVLFEPVHPMLALPAEDLDDARAKLEDPYLELKMDGARVQIHRDGDDVRIFTRKLNDVTASLPDIVHAVKAAPRARFVLDGEVIALDAEGRPYSFQTTMKRFGRAKDVAEAQARIPLSLFAFDCLHVGGETVVDRPASARLADLESWLPNAIAMPRLWSPSLDEARAFVARAYARGHEGAMAKAKDALYDAGRRGGQWLKIKQAFTVDLVVLGAEWGSGRREGWLSNLHLGALGPDGGFVMVGKTFKGLTDELLRTQTEALLARETRRWAHGIEVRPELVVEVALGGVQASGHYPGGLSLRFARVRRYRSDKAPHDIDTLGRLRDLVVRSG
jgi:DNA ligase-1